jgi:rhodanese-related sulfurtransferase
MHMAAPNEITPAQLSRLIGTPDCPVIVDVCIDEDHAADPYVIPGAIRHPHTELPALLDRLQGRPSVIACQKGKKLSQGVVSWLRASGLKSEYLSGGMVGWRSTQGAPSTASAALPPMTDGASLWVTRHRPKIDRIACPWLIRRFVDANARFLFVAPAEFNGVAEKFGAIPFDIEDTHYSHRGEKCTFDAMIDDFGLSTPALDTLATVVRGADTNTHTLSPECAGLLAISIGLSRQFKDDHAQLEAGMALYDALYRWARDGQGEGHDWPGTRGV